MSDNVQKYRNRALHLLKYRPRSVAEIKQRLQKAGALEEEIKEVIDTLLEHDLLNDKEFAQWLVTSRVSHKSRGIQAVKAELYKFGIDKELIKEIISKVDSEELVESAKLLLEKKRSKLAGLEAFKQKQKAFQYLSSRGYSYDVIRTAIDAWQEDK